MARRSLLLVGGLALLGSWPMLLGRVPLPASLVTQFPPWESVRGPDWRPPAHAEMGDLVTEEYPWKTLIRRSVAAGRLPLWNPHFLVGAPFVGDPQNALFYPLNLVYDFLPTPLAWSISIPLRMTLAGVLAALLASALGATRTAALAAGVVFAFCGWMTAFQTRPHVDTVVWLPLVFLAVNRLARRLDAGSAVLTGAAFALPVLAGQPECAVHVTLVGLAFFAFRLALPPPGASRARFTALFSASGLLALGLASVQMLPTLEFASQADRSLSASWGHIPLRQIAAFLSRDLGATPNSAGVNIPECAAYAGMLTLLAAPLALFHRNRRDAIFFLVLVACALEIIYGWEPAYWISQHTPVLRGIPNWRLLAVVELGLAVLAAMGLSALERALGARVRLTPAWWLLPAVALVLCGIGLAVIGLRDTPYPYPGGPLSLWTLRRPLASGVFLLAAAVLLGLALARRLRPAPFAAFALCLTAVDLATASYRFIPFVRPEEIFPPAPMFDFLGRDPTAYRVAELEGAYNPGFTMMYGKDSVAGFTIALRRTTSLLSPLGFLPHAPALTSEGVLASRGRLLDLLNVKYLVATAWNKSASALASRPDRFRPVFSDASVRVFENRSALPRAWLVPVSGVRVIASEPAQLAQVCSGDFDPSISVILPEKPAPREELNGERPAESSVRAIECGINDVRIEAAVSEPSILVLSQAFYPGWKVLVDQRDANILRANYGFQGAALSTGNHEVRFVYRPGSLRFGAAVSIAAILAGIVLCARNRKPSAG